MALKENQTIRPAIDMDGQQIIFEYRNRTPLRLDMTKVHPANKERASYVGMAQVRIVDAAAVARARKDGSIIPEAERDALKYARMQTLIEHYESGSADWSPRGTAADNTGLVVAAFARVKGLDVVVADAKLTAYADAKFDGDMKAALKYLVSGAEIAKAIVAIRLERLAPNDEADAALDDPMLA